MSGGEIASVFILGLLLGAYTAWQIVFYLLNEKFKRTVNSKCMNCKHFKECFGRWKKSRDDGTCKLYMEGEEQKMRTNPESVFYVIKRPGETFVFRNKSQAEEKKRAFKILFGIDVEIKVMKQSTIEELLGMEVSHG